MFVSNRSVCVVLLLVLAATLSGCGVDPKGVVAKAFENARLDIHAGNFKSGIKQLEDFLDRHSEHKLAPRANFLIAKGHLGLGDYATSKQWFNHVVEQFPKTEEAHKAKFKLAMISILQGEAADARMRLNELNVLPGPYSAETVAWLKYLEAEAPAE